MSNTQFKAPPIPPKAPAFGSVNTPVITAPVAGGATDPSLVLPEDNIAKKLKLSPSIFKTKTACIILGGTFIVGMILGAMMFGGGSTPPPPPPQGLDGVVPNPDITGGLRRCGLVSETEPCIVYIMNHTRNDHYAEDFFDEAVKITARPKYLISIENPHYTKTRIRPGHIAKIKIPRFR